MDNSITWIKIEVELLMYGYVGFIISKNDNGTVASWLAMADGGIVVSEDSKEFEKKTFEGLLEKLLPIELPSEEDDSMRLCWGISFADDDNNLVSGIDSGFWNEDVLRQIVELIETYFEDASITEQLHNIIEF